MSIKLAVSAFWYIALLNISKILRLYFLDLWTIAGFKKCIMLFTSSFLELINFIYILCRSKFNMSTKVLLLAAFIFAHTLTGINSSKPCPKECSCHSSWLRGVSSVVVDCSKRGLTSIPTKGVSRYVTSL